MKLWSPKGRDRSHNNFENGFSGSKTLYSTYYVLELISLDNSSPWSSEALQGRDRREKTSKMDSVTQKIQSEHMGLTFGVS